MTDSRRALPSISRLLDSASLRPLFDRAPRAVVADAARDAVEFARRNPERTPIGDDAWAAAVAAALEARDRRSLRPLFNATGVVLHTNLGRAPLASAAIDAVAAVAAGACNLEYDLERGERGSRYVHCVSLLTALTGAQDAIVVNNCASALVLALDTFAHGKEAIVSRGELIEIGGSFRVPDIMAKSGASLVEVGTTNRTHLADYGAALGSRTGAIVKVHRSNFEVRGFVAEASVRELAPLANERSVPLLYDFGSGLLISLAGYGLAGEPIASDAVSAGATVVLMSGDKLLGGPQAGIMVGSRDAIAACRKNPLARAVRVDKMTLAALEATLALYRDPVRAVHEVPVLAMLTAPMLRVRERAEAAVAWLHSGGHDAQVVDTEAGVGGGAFPSARIPSAAIAFGGDAIALEARLRGWSTPIIGRIANDRLLLDLRSIPERLDPTFNETLLAALA
jgi:L-seryl-tRNA(Ser) seleniumtransferase